MSRQCVSHCRQQGWGGWTQVCGGLAGDSLSKRKRTHIAIADVECIERDQFEPPVYRTTSSRFRNLEFYLLVQRYGIARDIYLFKVRYY